MNTKLWGIVSVGLLLLLVSVWQILSASRGLEITKVRSSEAPMTFITPASEAHERRPIVLIEHGFA